MSLLTRWRGEVAAIHDVRRLREVIRFAGVFVVTILLPALLLAYFALASIRSEELAIDADLRTRAAGVEGQVQQELTRVFDRFEQETLRRLKSGGSPLDGLGQLSPFLRVAFRLDNTGQVAAPFVPPTEAPVLPDNAAFREPWREGLMAETNEEWQRAADAFGRAARRANHPTLAAEASFARARNLAQLNRPSELNDVYSDFAGVRDRHGFRIGDLVVLTKAERRLGDDPDVAASTLQDLVSEILNRRWTIGEAGESSIARRALDRLPARFDPDWQARARTRLNARTEQLRWATNVTSELELLTAIPVEEGKPTYFAGPNSSVLWAVVKLDEEQYLFAFSLPDLLDFMRDTAARSTAGDADLSAVVVPNAESDTKGGLVQTALGPQLNFMKLSVRHADPDALEQQKANRRRARVAIVLLSVLVVAVGVLLSARIVGREIENARMKADFAANVSHELRSPITQIRLKAESLQLDLCYDQDDRQQHYDTIVRESERLSRLVDNVLDFASIERGAKRYSFRPDDLSEAVVTQVESMREALETKGMEVEIIVPDDTPPIRMDREAIGQVLVNLLSNAGKYGASGKWVGVSVESVGDRVEVSVSDRGIGISSDELPQVFDDFFRSQDAEVRRKKGTGIGLAIVRYIVEAHGGTIAVHSEWGEGTTFTLSFPEMGTDDAV